MMRDRAIALLLALAIVPSVGLAQSAKIRVGVLVEFDNKDIESEVTSYLSRELRSLGDVEVVTSGADLIVSVVGAGEDTLALSTVIERAHHGEWVQRFGIEIALTRGKFLKEGQDLPDETWKLARRFIGESDLLGQFANLTTRKTLKDTCVTLVAHIDTAAFSQQRARMAEIKKQPGK